MLSTDRRTARSFTRLMVAGVALLAFPSGAHAQLDSPLQINGYSSFEFEQRIGGDDGGDPNGSFDADLFDLVLNFRPTDRIRMATDLTWEHGTSTEDGRGNVAVEYAFMEIMASEALRVRVGKMLTPFGIYNEIHTAKPAFLTVKEPLSTNKNHKFGSTTRFYPRWTTGMALVGNGRVANREVDYVVQVSNGEQEETNPFEEDNNAAKALTARFRIRPSGELRLGASLYYDSLTQRDGADEDAGLRVRQLSYGAHAEWTPGNVGVELEYTGGRLTPDLLARQSRHAMTAMVYRTFADRYTPYLRLEFLDPDSQLADDTARLWVYGVNIQLDEGLYLKAELDTVTSGPNNLRFEGESFTELNAALALGF